MKGEGKKCCHGHDDRRALWCTCVCILWTGVWWDHKQTSDVRRRSSNLAQWIWARIGEEKQINEKSVSASIYHNDLRRNPFFTAKIQYIKVSKSINTGMRSFSQPWDRIRLHCELNGACLLANNSGGHSGGHGHSANTRRWFIWYYSLRG